MSFPLFGDSLRFKQPDGTEFDVLGWGDQHCARFETPQGLAVIRDPATRFFHFATLGPVPGTVQPSSAKVGIHPPHVGSQALGLAATAGSLMLPPLNPVLLRPRWQERHDRRKAAQRMHAFSGGILPAPPQRQTVGDYLGLCLLIDFMDDTAVVPRDEVDNFCNQAGYVGGGNHGSVYDYYLDNSIGRLRYHTIVAPYCRASQPKAYYTDPGVAFGVRAQELIAEALQFHKQNGFDFGPLSVDDRGGVCATNVFYAGKVDNNWGEGMWPHSSRLATPVTLRPGVEAVDYQVTALNQSPVLGTYCHENGHMLCDFPDLYQYTDQRLGVGRWCLMCGGGNADPLNPVNICGYLKYRAGWADIALAQPGLSMTIADQDNRMVLHARQEEYFLLEYRRKANRDAAVPGSGLAIWHVDELGSNSDPATAPDGHRRHEVSLVQADGRLDLDDGANDGDGTDLFVGPAAPSFSATTDPSSLWWDGSPSGLRVANVRIDAAGKLEFDVV